MSWQQFIEWEVYASLEPFDEEREDIRAASIVAAIYNAVLSFGKRKKEIKITDVLLTFGDSKPTERPAQTWQAMKAIGRMMASAFNLAEDAKKKGIK